MDTRQMAKEATKVMFGMEEEEIMAKTEEAWQAVTMLEPIEIGYLLLRLGSMQKHIASKAAEMGDSFSAEALNEVSAGNLNTALTIIKYDKQIKAAVETKIGAAEQALSAIAKARGKKAA